MCVWSMCACVHNETHDTDQISFIETDREAGRISNLSSRTWSPGRRWLANAHVPKKGSEFASCLTVGLVSSQVGGFFWIPRTRDASPSCLHRNSRRDVSFRSLSKQWAPGGCTSSSLPMEIPTTIYNFYNLINLPDVTMASWGEVSHPIQWMNTPEVWSSVVADKRSCFSFEFTHWIAGYFEPRRCHQILWKVGVCLAGQLQFVSTCLGVHSTQAWNPRKNMEFDLFPCCRNSKWASKWKMKRWNGETGSHQGSYGPVQVC